MRIGEIGQLAGVSAKTIRYYEEIGLMPEPARTASGYRDYGEAAVERLRFVRDAQAAGLSLDEINSVLDMRDQGERTCGHVIHLLERHIESIDRQLTQLRTTRRMLTGMLERAQELDPAACVDPNRCQTITRDDRPARSGRRTGVPGRHVHD